MQIVFESLREQSPQIRKLAVHILWQVLVKQADQSYQVIDNVELVRLFKIQKLQLIRLSQPLLHYAKPDQPDQMVQWQSEPVTMLRAI